MRYIGLDLGTTTLGTSISDKTNTLVSPLKLIKFPREDYDKALDILKDLINSYEKIEFVLGLPKNMDNTLGFAAERSLKFKEKLESLGYKVYLEDERLTTVEALGILKNNGMKKINKQDKTDVLSAILILEEFLKRMQNENKK